MHIVFDTELGLCIHYVQHMVVPVDREGKVVDSTLLRREPSSSAALEPVNTRKAGGRQDRGPQTVSA